MRGELTIAQNMQVIQKTGLFAGLVLTLLLSACGDDQKKVEKPKHTVRVVNEASTEANVRIKFFTKDYVRISVEDEAELEIPEDLNTVQVEARSRKWNDSCWVTMQVGQTMIFYQDGERVGCKVAN